MIKIQNSSLLPGAPLVVGTVHSEDSLRSALRIAPSAIDLVELRVDAFGADPSRLHKAAQRLQIPLIVTVRHPAEGGAQPLSTALRRALYLEFLPLAAFIDVELRSTETLREVIAAARERGVRVVISSHDFHRTPSSRELQRRVARARQAGADLCKLATFTRTPSDLARLVTLFASRRAMPLSVMGMGPLGKISRLLLARLGSRLNYGYLHRPNADGQWEARELKTRLGEL